jgi:hypothetical protein
MHQNIPHTKFSLKEKEINNTKILKNINIQRKKKVLCDSEKIRREFKLKEKEKRQKKKRE